MKSVLEMVSLLSVFVLLGGLFWAGVTLFSGAEVADASHIQTPRLRNAGILIAVGVVGTALARWLNKRIT